MNIDLKETNYSRDIERVRLMNEGRELYGSVITLGCQQNEADSEKIRAMLSAMGYKITDNTDISDIIIVNTCAIREHAELKALSIVGNFKALRELKPELIVGVCGCMAAEAHRAEKIKKSYHHVSFTLEPTQLHKLPELVYKSLTTRRRSFLYGEENFDVVECVGAVRVSSHKAWVSIMYGCNNYCSYCIVPYVRGRERSRMSADIINECKELIDKGYREITLLGQNVNSYNSDITFPELLSKIAQIPGDFILRFMTSHPKDASDELIEVFGKYSGKIAPAFHLPLQSGSNKILREMNRTYTREKYLDTVRKIREAVPNVALTSDIIVGFPGETDEDFADTMDILRTVRFDMVYSFNYSKREGTRAARMQEQVPYEIMKKRMAELLDVQCNISREINDEYLGKELRIIVDDIEDNNGVRLYSGRTATNKLVHFSADDDYIGKFVKVKITRTGAFDLFGEMIGE